MKQSKFCDVFIRIFGEKDTADFIDGMFGKKKDDSTGFNYQTLNFKCFRIEEDYYILDLETGVLIVWYKQSTSIASMEFIPDKSHMFQLVLYAAQ